MHCREWAIPETLLSGVAGGAQISAKLNPDDPLQVSLLVP